MNSFAISEMDEKNRKIKELKQNLTLKETELCETRKQLNEYKEECDRLNKVNQVWETDLKSLNIKCADAKSSLARAIEKLTLERESLCHELQIKCKRLYDMEARYDEEKCNGNSQKCKYNNLFSTLIEVNKMSGQNHYDMKNKVHELQREICKRNDDICNLKNKMKELQQENELKCVKIKEQKNTLCERECQLTQMVLLSDKIMKIKQKYDAYCCALPNPCATPKCYPKDPCCTKDPCCPEKKPCILPITCPKPKCCPKDPCCTKDPCCPPRKIGKPCLLPISCPKPRCCSKYPCCPKEPSCLVKTIKKPCALPITCPKPKCCPKDPCCPEKKCVLPITCPKPTLCPIDPCCTKDPCCPEKVACTLPIICTKPKCCSKDPCCSQLKPPLQKCTIITDANNNVIEDTKLNNLCCELEEVKKVVGQALKNKL